VRRTLIALALTVVAVCSVVALRAQTHYDSGQNVVPVYEGWEKNADGSFTMVFGYMNRNYEEELDIPVGPDNKFETLTGGPNGVATEPRVADQGQPTHFYTRRQQFMFRVKVPKDWGNKDFVWTLTSRGKTEKAYGSLWPVWEIDFHVYQQNRAGPGELGEKDEAPTISLVGSPTRTIKVGHPLAIAVTVKDDGLPTPRATRSGSATGGAAAVGAGRGAAAQTTVAPARENPTSQGVVRLDPGMGLGVVWVVHRRPGPSDVRFEPAKAKVASGQASTSVTFDKPGTYVLRGYADDGVLLDSTDVTVTVTP